MLDMKPIGQSERRYLERRQFLHMAKRLSHQEKIQIVELMKSKDSFDLVRPKSVFAGGSY